MGLLLAVSPEHPNFLHATRLAEAALQQGVQVYFYCVDEAVRGLQSDPLPRLKAAGLKLFACAYGAQKRRILLDENAVFAGLSIVHDLIASTDRFICFSAEP